MYHFKGNYIEINGNKREFKYKISKVEKYKKNYIVLVEIPFDKKDINNIYCLDEQTNIVWQVEDLNKVYPTSTNMPYEQMGIMNNCIYACDFIGWNYCINIETGKIEGCKFVK